MQCKIWCIRYINHHRYSHISGQYFYSTSNFLVGYDWTFRQWNIGYCIWYYAIEIKVSILVCLSLYFRINLNSSPWKIDWFNKHCLFPNNKSIVWCTPVNHPPKCLNQIVSCVLTQNNFGNTKSCIHARDKLEQGKIIVK